MNQKLFILPLIAVAAQAMAQSDVTINLKDKTVDSLSITVTAEDFNESERTFFIPAKGSKAIFHLPETTPRAVLVESIPQGKGFRLLTVPGTKVKVKGSWQEQKISGHPIYNDEKQFETSVKDITKESDSLYIRFDEARDRKDILAIRQLSKDIDKKQKEYLAKVDEFIAGHPNSPYSVYLAIRIFGPPTSDEKLATLTPEVQNGYMKSYINATRLADKRRQEEEEKQGKASIEQYADAPEIALPSLDGTELKLSSLRGKVVVLDFWGSWCGWCIKSMPALKEAYEKYAGRLEILGIDCHDTEELWHKAVEQNELNWKHVRIDKKNDAHAKVLEDYAVKGYPTKIIISPEGKILNVTLGEMPNFYKILDEVMAQ